MNEEQSNIVELVDEEGHSVFFQYLMTIDYDEKEYVILSPTELAQEDGEEADVDEVVILRVQQDENQNDVYVSIDNKEEVEEVFEAFNQILNTEIN